MQISAQHLAEIVEAAHKADQAPKDKRRYVRQGVVSRIEILRHLTGKTYAALTRDISLEGLGVMQPFDMERGEQFSVSLPRIKGTALMAQCTVLHTREIASGIWGIGAAFNSITSAENAQSDIKKKAEAKRIAAQILD